MIRVGGIALLVVVAAAVALVVVAALILRGRRGRSAQDHLGGYFRRQLAAAPVSRVTSTTEPARPLPRSRGFVAAREALELPGFEVVDADRGIIELRKRVGAGERNWLVDDGGKFTFHADGTFTGDRAAAFDALRAQVMATSAKVDAAIAGRTYAPSVPGATNKPKEESPA